MKKKICEDCWPPLSGSWEETVDPYDEQFTRQQSVKHTDKTLKMVVENISETQGDQTYRTTATV